MHLKKEIKFLLYAHLILAIFLIYELFDLITLLYDDSHQFAFLSNELNNENYLKSQPQLIPKIIHQTYKTNDIPKHWQEGQKNCQIFNSDYQYILWTDEMARDFISENYPWFLKTFDNYKYPIERADVIRYFILSYYGGIYIDLDDSCARNLDPLLTVPAFVRKTLPTGISNDIMGSVPNHPFFTKAISMLKRYQRNWLIPYITIMFSTGPLYLSVVWKQYIRWGNPPSGIVRILMPDDYKNSSNAFFKITKGSSWHKDDAAVLLLMAKHIPITIILCILLAILIFLTEYAITCWIFKIYGSKFSKLQKKVHGLFVQYLPLLKLSSINNSNNNINNKWQSIPRKSRKDSNLPSALAVDLEKNVLILNEIEEA
jgi:mannosyltransferase OCH1-like enzyme